VDNSKNSQLISGRCRAFAKKFEGYTVKEAIYFEGTEESAYFISAQNEKGSVIFKVEDNGSVSMKKM